MKWTFSLASCLLFLFSLKWKLKRAGRGIFFFFISIFFGLFVCLSSRLSLVYVCLSVWFSLCVCIYRCICIAVSVSICICSISIPPPILHSLLSFFSIFPIPLFWVSSLCGVLDKVGNWGLGNCGRVWK